MRRALPWVVRVLWDPVVEFDLLDAKGKPDHGKVVPALVVLWLLVLATIQRVPSLGFTIAVLAASFGGSTFRAFLRSRTVVASETILHTTITQNLAEREQGDGTFQPTP